MEDRLEKNVYACLSCSRRFTRLSGRLLELAARPPAPEEKRAAVTDRRTGARFRRSK
jgi:hypothetical protein